MQTVQLWSLGVTTMRLELGWVGLSHAVVLGRQVMCSGGFEVSRAAETGFRDGVRVWVGVGLGFS